MAAWLPLPSGFTGYATRFVDPALGFSLGWNYWFKVSLIFPAFDGTITPERRMHGAQQNLLSYPRADRVIAYVGADPISSTLSLHQTISLRHHWLFNIGYHVIRSTQESLSLSSWLLLCSSTTLVFASSENSNSGSRPSRLWSFWP